MIKEARLWERLDQQKVHCCLCAHECKIPQAQFGVCGVRRNDRGTLNTMIYADVIAANIDPIEKKPLYHFLPGSRAYSIATIGCNFKCGFCQNWRISQAAAEADGIHSGRETPPARVVEQARKNDCRSIAYTYTEPTIFFEYAFDVAKLASAAGLYNVFVTNGYMTRRTLDEIRPYLHAANVDLKSFRDDFYRKNCNARLQPVLDTISAMKSLGVWLEVTTLVIPGENDTDDELRQIAEFLAGVDRMIPWHLSAFHPDYEFSDRRTTPLETLRKAKELGRQAGLNYVYLGNVMEGGNTLCHSCHRPIIKRQYMGLDDARLANGRCPYCGAAIAGVWS